MEEILDLIREERRKQDEKWGGKNFLNDYSAMTILTEEIGEVAHAILEKDFKNMEEELVQVAAVCVKWLESIRGV